MMKFRRSFRLALLLASGVALASCGSATSNSVSFRMIQASPDLAPVNFLVDGVILRSAVDYKGGPGFLTVTPQTYEFAVEALLPGVDGVFGNVPLSELTVQKPLAAGNEYTLIAIGKDATDTVQPLIIENLIEDVPQGNARLQFVHAAPDVPAVDIYLTAVPASPDPLPDLSTQTPMAQVTYGEQPEARQLVLPGLYVIRVTLAGSTDPVFDSGEITLSDRSDFLMIAVDNSAAGASPISLAVNSGFRTYYSPNGTFDILDKNSPSELRVVQVSPDAPDLDVVGARPVPALPAPPLPEVTFASGLTYLDNTGYVSAIPDAYAIRGVKTSEPNPVTPLFAFPKALFIGQRATLFTTGLLATINPLVLADEIRSVFAEGKLRIVDASPASATVDVYILATGTDIATVVPTLSNLVLHSATSYLPFFPRNYTVTFTTAGTKTPLATAEVAATEGTVQTAILVDAVRVDSGSDGKPAAVLLIDDLSS